MSNYQQRNAELRRPAPAGPAAAAAMSRAQSVIREDRYRDDAIARMREESVLDKSIPLGIPPPFGRPLSGPSVENYYRTKHAAGEVARFYPLHITKWERSR